MEAFLVSTSIVAIAEIGDKTQLLALLLAARFRRPIPIIAGIFVATIANHALAALVGQVVSMAVGPEIMRWVLGLSFIAMGLWMLVPDSVDDEDDPVKRSHASVFLATTIAFFTLEMGDKTQIATVALAARYLDVVVVAMGTTLGMMIANVPAVLLGNVAAEKLPLKLVHAVAASIFVLLGILTLMGFMPSFGQ
ncbi:MAG: TMEM165/GDT1 family protein [Alphaproteobacteria bacterium]|nr:TMEM165/GDT1 family protein [Alphaproteobacteria bacterium]